MSARARIPRVLSIAGSDPSGGAGIQADLKTFSALGAYGTCALTALTAQNTQGVRGVSLVDPGFLGDQIDAVLDDIPADAVKIGMAGSAGSVQAIARCLERHRPAFVVIDPVMVAKSGDRLVDDDAVGAIRDRLLPLATLITPNLAETGVLLGERAPADVDAMAAAGARLRGLGPAAALVKGGHLAGPTVTDVLCGADGPVRLEAPRVHTRNTHGTGCTLSSAIAALRPRAPDLARAVGAARRYLTTALEAGDALAVGHGHGPPNHFAALWSRDPAAAALAEAATPTGE